MIEIRAAEAGDATAIAEIYAPYVRTSGVSIEAEPPSAETMSSRIANGGSHPWLVATDGATVLGYAFAGPFRARHAYRFVVETSIFLINDASAKTVGRLLYGSLIATLKEQGFTQAIAGIALPSDNAISLHESVGFRRAGVYREVGFKPPGQWVDVGFWQCMLSEPNDPPDEPVSFTSVGVVRG